MSDAARRWAFAGALIMGLAVMIGAFGAHGLRGRVSGRDLDIWETAARYQAYHGLGLLLLAALRDRLAKHRLADIAGALFITGVAIFCGSLYLLVATQLRWLGAITPLGGASWIAAWFLLAFSARGEAEAPR